jgi:hypothetical protein
MLTIPLLNISLPANVYQAFLEMLSILSFKIIDEDQIPHYFQMFPFFSNEMDEFYQATVNDTMK